MHHKPGWRYFAGILVLAGIGIGCWGCYSESPSPPSGYQAKQPSASEGGGSIIPSEYQLKEKSQASYLSGRASGTSSDLPAQAPTWWDRTAPSQTADLPETSPSASKLEPSVPPQTPREIEKTSLPPARPAGPASEQPASEGLRPNPLREGPIQAEPLRPEQIGLEIGPKESAPIAPKEPGMSGAEGRESRSSSEASPKLELPPQRIVLGGPSSEKPDPDKEASPAGYPLGVKTSGSRPPFDPYKEHGHFFVGWPKPKLALVLTGNRNGYFEPCGCAGKDRMIGGVSRLHTMLLELRQKRGWPTVALDVGGVSKGSGLQGVLKFHALTDAMRKMGYEAVGFGMGDLKYDLGDLIAAASEVDGKPGLFISSNVALMSWDAGFTGKPRIIEAGGLKIGVIAVLGREFQNQILSKEILFEDSEKVTRQQTESLRKQCDLLILLAHASRQESLELAKKVPVFDVVVTSGGAPAPPAEPQPIEGQKGWLIEVGEKGMYAAVVAFYDDPKQPRRYQRVVLDSRYPDSEPMRQIMVAYQEQLKDLGLKGLGLQPVRDPRQELNGPFVGSKQCESCHEPSYKVWKRSGHAKAWGTLLRADPPRHHDPECISCHVVGWNPQKYFPYQSGFWSEKQTSHLTAVGCESCHGPGGKHVDAEMGRLGSDEATKQKYRQAVTLPLADAEKTCLECHDLDNSPDFNFKTYWPKVEHRED